MGTKPFLILVFGMGFDSPYRILRGFSWSEIAWYQVCQALLKWWPWVTISQQVNINSIRSSRISLCKRRKQASGCLIVLGLFADHFSLKFFGLGFTPLRCKRWFSMFLRSFAQQFLSTKFQCSVQVSNQSYKPVTFLDLVIFPVILSNFNFYFSLPFWEPKTRQLEYSTFNKLFFRTILSSSLFFFLTSQVIFSIRQNQLMNRV